MVVEFLNVDLPVYLVAFCIVGDADGEIPAVVELSEA
jgi:hypothetical protein